MSDLLVRHDRVMGDGAPMFYDEPVQLSRGEGVWLEATDGTRYLDLYNNVPCVGHANPRVAGAIAEQMARLNVHSRYVHESVVAYVERLVGLHHDGIESAVLACSGTEATEMALTMARLLTGRRGLIGTNATYHGNSSLVSRLTKLPVGTDREGVKSISAPQTFRPLEAGLSEAELCQRHLDELEATIASFDDEGGFAGIMLCSILANEGLPNAPAGWFDQAVTMVRDAGGIVIADEVQADATLGDGLQLLSTPGHTPGHTSLAITTGAELLVVTGDLLHHPFQFASPDLAEVGDVDADQARATRKDFFSEYARAGAVIAGTHFPVAPVGRTR